MKKLSIRLFLLLTILGFTFTVASCKENKVGLQLDFEKNSYEVILGDELVLTPQVTNGDIADLKLEWNSTDETVATCADGKITSVGLGTTTVKAWVEGKAYIAATAKITVVESDPKGMPVATFDVEGPADVEGTLYIGDENKLVYELSHEYPNVEMVFSSSDEEIATIDEEVDKKATEENRDAIIAERESKVYSNKLTEWQKEDGWKVNESVVEKIEFHNILTQKDPNAKDTEKNTEKGTESTEKTDSTENK